MTQLTSGVPAPNLVLPAIDGSVFDLSKVKGKARHSHVLSFLIVSIMQHENP